MTQIRYRYRTPALAGRWRDTRDEAVRDALAAQQAVLDSSAPGGLRWLVQGEIEEQPAARELIVGSGALRPGGGS